MYPELGAYYGKDFPSPVHPPILSPNIDKPAANSLLLKRAYCQKALSAVYVHSQEHFYSFGDDQTPHICTISKSVGGSQLAISQPFHNTSRLFGMLKNCPPSGGGDPIS